MNISHLEAVHLVAEHGSVSKAAAASGIAQSALSRSVSLVEAEWGQRLFERTGRGLVPTEDFGVRMLAEVDALLNHWKQLHLTAHEASEEIRGTVRVAMAPSLAKLLVRPLLSDISITHPEIKICLQGGPSSGFEEQVLAGKLDVALLVRYSDQHHSGEEFLADIAVYCVCTNTSPLAKRRVVSMRQLLNCPLVLPPRPNTIRPYLDAQAHQLGMRVNAVVEAESIVSLKEVVLSGTALAILPLSTVKDEIAAGTLAALRIESPTISRKVMLATASPSSSASRFVAARLRRMVSTTMMAQAQLSN